MLLVLVRRHREHRATHVTERSTGCRSEKSPKSSALPDAEDDQISFHLLGISDDLVENEADCDLDLHPSAELLRYRQQPTKLAPGVHCELFRVVDSWKLRCEPRHSRLGNINDVKQTHRAAAVSKEAKRFVE